MTIVISGGDNASRLNLLLIAEGYTLADRPLFDMHVEQLAKAIRSEPWYRQGIINVHALWVPSAESTLDIKPAEGPRDTAFRFELGGEGKLDRMIGGSDALVRGAVEGRIIGPVHAIVLCNSTREGGWGGPKGEMCWVTAGRRGKVMSTGMPSWCDMALHELGHSLFGLGDEYEAEGTNRKVWPDDWAEPARPNVTKDPTGAKWKHVVSSPPIEGAGRYDQGLYRPTANCRMRGPGRFCPVCEDVVSRTLEGFLREGREPEPEPESDAEKLFSVIHQGETKQFSDDISGIIAASGWLFGRKFGSTQS